MEFRRPLLAFFLLSVIMLSGRYHELDSVEAQGPDFQLIVSPPTINVPQNEAAQYSIRIQSVRAFTGTVSFSVERLPTEFSASFSPGLVAPQAEGTAYSILTILAATTISGGLFTFTVVAQATAAGPASAKRTDVTLIVYQIGTPDFVLSVSPSQQFITQAQFQSQTFTSKITVTPRNSFFGTVTFNLHDQPLGLFATFDPLQLTLEASATSRESIFRINVFSGFFTTTTFYFLAISGTGTGFGQPTGVTKTVIFQLGVSAAPDFTISLNPSIRTINPGEAATYTVALSAVQGGFGGNIALSVTGQPPDVSFFFDPQPATLITSGQTTSTLTVNTSPRTPPDRYVLTVTATGGGSAIKTVDIQLVVNPIGDFSMTAEPTSTTIGLGSTRTVTLKIQSRGGFRSLIALSVPGGAPGGSGVSLAVQPVEVIPTPDGTVQASFIVTTDRVATTRTHVFSVVAKSGQLSRDARITVSVRQSFGCLIATATYGSEASPQVQLLREFRDGSVLATSAGGGFMGAFHGWYYSFSPYIADLIAENPPIKEGSKILLYPLVNILQLSAATYDIFRFNHELAILLTGILASGLIGVAYFTLPASMVLLLTRRKVGAVKLLKPLGTIAILSVMLLGLGQLGHLSILVTVGAVGVVVSTVIASSLSAAAILGKR